MSATWLQRLENDAKCVLDRIQAAFGKGRLGGFSIGELVPTKLERGKTNRSRERIYGALAYLIAKGLVTVEGDGTSQARFFPKGRART